MPNEGRTDAQRNRERILEVAKAAFTRSGADASFDDIAKQAGVGPGTLYRHFPTRDALLEAVYHTEVEKLAAAQRELSANLPRSRRCGPGPASRADWRLQRGDRNHRLAGKLQETRGHPDQRFAANKGELGDLTPGLSQLGRYRSILPG